MKNSLIRMPLILWALFAGTSLSAIQAWADETTVTDPSGEPGVADDGNSGSSGEEPSGEEPGGGDGTGAGNDDGSGGVDPGGGVDDGTPVDDSGEGSGTDVSITVEDAGGDPAENSGYDPTIAQSSAAETADGGLKSIDSGRQHGAASRMTSRDSGEAQWPARKPRRSLFGSNSPWSDRTARKAQ